MEEQLEQIAVFDDDVELELARSELVLAGIDTFVPDELTLATQRFLAPGFGGFRLLVHRADAETARLVLAEIEAREPPPDDVEDEHEERCAHCGAAYLARKYSLGAWLGMKLLRLPARWFREQEWCMSCGEAHRPSPAAAAPHPYRGRLARPTR